MHAELIRATDKLGIWLGRCPECADRTTIPVFDGDPTLTAGRYHADTDTFHCSACCRRYPLGE